MNTKPYILTIAGFDPSGGAGLIADTKTIHAIGGYALSVCTANTVQNDKDFSSCYWTSVEVIMEQLEVLLNRFTINYVKIGIVENWSVLADIVSFLKAKNPTVTIVLDPVLRSSTNFNFHTEKSNESLKDILQDVLLITPNANEIKKLGEGTVAQTIKSLQAVTNVLLKGGHNKDNVGKDVLYTKQNESIVFKPKSGEYFEKHGSGCVLSSAITTYLALGNELPLAIEKGKRYIEQFLASNQTLLGYHTS